MIGQIADTWHINDKCGFLTANNVLDNFININTNTTKII